jgi:hypothetical protein
MRRYLVGIFGALAVVCGLALATLAIHRAPKRPHGYLSVTEAAAGLALPEVAAGIAFEEPPPGVRNPWLPWGWFHDVADAQPSAAQDQPPDLNVVRVVRRPPFPPPSSIPWSAPLVSISRTSVRFPRGDVTLAVPADAAAHGFGAAEKGGSRKGYLVPPLAESFDRVREGGAFDEQGYVVLADQDVPYRIVMEVIYSAATAHVLYPYFGARHGTSFVALETSPTPIVERHSRGPLLDVELVSGGFVLHAGDPIGPGCTRGAEGVTIPLLKGVYDYDALAACAKRVDEDPGGTNSGMVRILADGAQPFGTMLKIFAVLEQALWEDEMVNVHFDMYRED